jgi:hypothetical protein
MSGGGKRLRCSHHWEHPQTLNSVLVRALDAALETIMRRVLWIAVLLFAARFGISQ